MNKGKMEEKEKPIEKLLTNQDLQKWLDISETKLAELRKKGDFPAPKMIGKSPRWQREVIQEWLNKK